MMPYYPIEDTRAYVWDIYSYNNKMIADYCRISISEVVKMPLDVWLMYRRDAFIFNCEQSENGKKYLKNAYLMRQKKPDLKKLKEVFG